MQIQTTTITTENANILGANFQITAFEQTVSAICDICGNSDEGAAGNLKNAGWSLSSTDSGIGRRSGGHSANAFDQMEAEKLII